MQPSALFAQDHAPNAIFSVKHERERYFNWFIVAAFLASAALNDLKLALRGKQCCSFAIVIVYQSAQNILSLPLFFLSQLAALLHKLLSMAV